MPPIPLVLPTQSTIGRDGQAASARLINAYAEENGGDAKSQFTVYAAPGLTAWSQNNIPLEGPSRGLIELTPNALIGVQGRTVVEYEGSGAATLRGLIIGTKRLHMARNRRATPQIGIVSSVGDYYVLENGVMTIPLVPDLPAPCSIDYLKGFFVFGIETENRIYASDLENALNVDGAAFDYAKSDSSRLRLVKAHAGYLYVFKERGAEIWRADPDLASEAFPFSPVQQDIEIGLSSPHSVASFERGLGWVDHERIVRFGKDNAANRISSHTVERALEELTAEELEDVYGFAYTFQGHETYVLTCARWTWCFDVLTTKWYERRDQGGGPWRPLTHALFNGRDIVGTAGQRLWEINPNAYSDGDDRDIIMEIWLAQSHRFPAEMIVDALDIDVITGLATNIGDPHSDHPMMTVDYSDNGGKTFHGERFFSLGELGDFEGVVSMARWGRVTVKGRIWRLRASAGILRGVNQAGCDARPLR